MKRSALIALLAITAFSAQALQVYSPLGVTDVTTVNAEGFKPTYSVVAADVAPAATATDIVTISASATKTIRVTRIWVTGDATGNNTVDIYLYKRTTANAGGTTAALTPAKHDSADGAPTATVVKYTANASSLGTGVLIRAGHLALPATSNPTVFSSVEWSQNGRPAKTFVLRAGTTESLAISMNGNAVPSGTQLYVNIEWTEE